MDRRYYSKRTIDSFKFKTEHPNVALDRAVVERALEQTKVDCNAWMKDRGVSILNDADYETFISFQVERLAYWKWEYRAVAALPQDAVEAYRRSH